MAGISIASSVSRAGCEKLVGPLGWHFCGKLSGICDRAFLAEKDQLIEQPGAVPVESREKQHMMCSSLRVLNLLR